jgi:drug/metabolite transporter (DMT)-like permease
MSEEVSSARADEQKSWIGLLYVGLAVGLFSTTPVFIRWAGALHPLVITCLRMWIGAATVSCVALLQGRNGARPVRRLSRAEWVRFAGWGLVTALHFVFYIGSLDYTTVAHSLALVYTSPIWVSLCSWIFLGEALPRFKWIGILVTLAGMGVLSGFEPNWTPRMLIGDVMALGSAITFGLYSVAGRSQRDRYPLWRYASLVYAMAGLWLLPLAAWAWLARAPSVGGAGRLGAALLSVLILGIFPLGIGHTLYNAALRRTHPTRVNIVATQEVTGGVLLSWWLLGEVPTVNALIGAGIMLLGVIQVII